MARKETNNLNFNDDATVIDAQQLNKDNAIKILDANSKRFAVRINNNDENFGVWIRLMPATEDNTEKKGDFLVKKGGTPFVMDGVSIYRGEISAIAEGDSPDVYVTEY